MIDREKKVIKGLECCSVTEGYCWKCPYETDGYFAECTSALARDALALLKEQEATNVDAFVQWCIDNHIMGDATVEGIKYWVGKYKEQL